MRILMCTLTEPLSIWIGLFQVVIRKAVHVIMVRRVTWMDRVAAVLYH